MHYENISVLGFRFYILHWVLHMTVKLPDSPPLVTVVVNGRELQLPKGKNLLQALLDVGHYIPHYCYHPSLSVAGNCRLCLIEIEGRPKPEISCNMVVSENLKILTDSQLVEDCRKGMMEFLLINHPLDCPICDQGGECMLQRYSREYGWGTARMIDPRRRFHKPQFDPLIDIERNRCIMCTRCTRFCDEVAGEHVMGVFGHGNRNYIGTFGNGPVSNPFSGNVIDLCPVGCLTSKPYRFMARPWEMRQIATTPRLANGTVTAWTRGGKLYRATPPARKRHGGFTIDEDTTRFISNEVRFGSYYANSAERLVEPLARNADGRQSPVNWDHALARASEALATCAPGEACVLVGERSTNEEAFLLGRLARVQLRTPHVDWRSRYASEAAAQAVGLALAASDGDFDLLERRAYKSLVLVAASEFHLSAPDIALRRRAGARLTRAGRGVVDARADRWLGNLAETAWLEQPGRLAGTLNTLAEALEKGKNPENAPAGMEKLFALLLEEQGLLGLGLDGAGGALAPALVPAALRLMRALGPGWHFLPLTAARNAKGAFAAGGQSDRLPNGALADAGVRGQAAASYGLEDAGALPATAGPAAPGLLERAAEGGFKALLLHRCDELVHHPRRELIERALEATPTVIAIDIFPSWITERATVVLPGSLFYECDGSMTDIDGTLRRMSKGVKPPGGAQEEWRIITALALRLGAKVGHTRAHDIFTELASAWGAPLILDDLLLEQPGPDSPQRHHQYFGQRSRAPFKLHERQRAVPTRRVGNGDESTSDKTPRLWWIQHSQGPDHLGSRASTFDGLRPRPRLELHPEDASRLGLAEGDWVVIEGGAAEPSQVVLNRTIAPGLAFGAANVLGLRLTAGADLPLVRLRKTDPPADVSGTQAEEVAAES